MTDSSSAIVHASRLGLGGLRHMEVRFLWVQNEVRSGRIEIKKIAGILNTTDVATKHVDSTTMAKCQTSAGMRPWSPTSGLLLAALLIPVATATADGEESHVMTSFMSVILALAFVGVIEAVYRARRLMRAWFPPRAFCHAATQTEALVWEAPCTSPFCSFSYVAFHSEADMLNCSKILLECGPRKAQRTWEHKF